MQELLYALHTSKYYQVLLLSIKSVLFSLAGSCMLLIGIKSAGLPVDAQTLYQQVVTKTYDTKEVSLEEPSHQNVSFAVSGSTKEELSVSLTPQVQHLVAQTETKQMHGVSDTIPQTQREKKTEKICSVYTSLCEVITLEGNFTPIEEYVYTLLSVFFLDHIDQTLSFDNKKLTDGLHSLKLRSHLSDDPSLGACYTERRGCADHHEVIINLELVESFNGFANVLVHEVGHIVDLGVIKGNEDAGLDKTYREFGSPTFAIDDLSLGYYALSFAGETVRKKGATRQDFCSLYAMTNIFEDFAECVNLIKNHADYFKILAQTNRVLQKKYQFLANIIGEKYLFNDAKNAKVAQKDPSKRFRDTTKMSK